MIIQSIEKTLLVATSKRSFLINGFRLVASVQYEQSNGNEKYTCLLQNDAGENMIQAQLPFAPSVTKDHFIDLMSNISEHKKAVFGGA